MQEKRAKLVERGAELDNERRAAAHDGANIAIAAKTDKPHPKLPGTIYTAADDIERAGGKALPLVLDVRDEAMVKAAQKWFAPHTAYSMAKFGMSLVILGLAGELRSKGIAVNALWPRTVIATAAVQNLLGGEFP